MIMVSYSHRFDSVISYGDKIYVFLIGAVSLNTMNAHFMETEGANFPLLVILKHN